MRHSPVSTAAAAPALRAGARGHTPGIGWLAATVFLATSAPRLNLPLGPIPLYVVDLLAGMALLYALRGARGRLPRQPFGATVAILFAFAVLGEVAGAITTRSALEPVYLILRNALAFSTFYAAYRLVRTRDDLRLVLKAALLGLVITALLMILTSLPMTRAPVLTYVFGNRFLEPAARLGGAVIHGAEEAGGVRGRTLVGVSIMGASVLNAMWPLAALLLRWPHGIGAWRRIAMFGCLLAPMGVLMSYSRGPILGTLIIVLAVVVFGLGRVRRGILVPVVVGAVVVLSVGVGSNLFFFERLERRTAAIFEDPLADEREYERLLAYSEPFGHLVEHPRFLIVGEGMAIGRSHVMPEQAGKATHALFAQAYYSHGMIAAVLYMLLIARAFFFVLKQLRRPKGSLGLFYAQTMLLCLLGLVPWALFGHAIVSQPRGTLIFFLVLGLVTTLRQFEPSPASAGKRRTAHVYGRRAAVG